jgi:hypothetical protein
MIRVQLSGQALSSIVPVPCLASSGRFRIGKTRALCGRSPIKPGNFWQILLTSAVV